ncbi:Hypothetical protein PBC10988_3120 [Planctomycetales bacterium 10988]|nr:Hypothetical protein PBC10988_3120 [Planctomycetales bacterium 10988]
MITLTRKQLRTARSLLRRTLGLRSRNDQTPVEIAATAEGTSVRAASQKFAIEYLFPGNPEMETIVLPYATLAECEGTRQDPVRVHTAKDQVVLQWEEKGFPQCIWTNAKSASNFPARPEEMQENPSSLMTLLAEAVAITSKESSRFALDCLRLRGHDGQLAATDGRQALVQAGFDFPWEDALLIPACPGFTAKEFLKEKPVRMGKTEDWVAIQSGPCTIWCRIDQQRHFPDIDRITPNESESSITLTLTDHDASFLHSALSRLPGKEEYNAPITLDLSENPIIRAKSTSHPTTELLLCQSTCIGEKLRCCTNRLYLARALELGFRSFRLKDANSPILCHKNSKTYFWAPLDQSGVLPPEENSLQIESAPPKLTATHAA